MNLQELMDTATPFLAGLGPVFTVIGATYLAIGRRRAKLQGESIAQSKLTALELERTRDDFRKTESMLRTVIAGLETQNHLLRVESDRWRELYGTKRDELSEANIQIRELNRQVKSLQDEVNELRAIVAAMQAASSTRTVTDVHIVKESPAIGQ